MINQVLLGNSKVVLKTLPDNSVDSVVTDPPYELGFKGKGWDSSGIAYDIELWKEVFRVLKPGGHILAFGGSRTYHRMVCAVEDAGFEIRDCIMWIYGSGFPKSLNVSLAIDKKLGVQSEIVGVHKQVKDDAYINRDSNAFHGENSFSQHWEIKQASSDLGKSWSGWGTALKPAHEPIVVARKPLDGTVADNVLNWGVGAININECRVKDPSNSRYPANIIHDGSDEVVASFPGNLEDNTSRFFYCAKASKKDRGLGNIHPTVKPQELMTYLVKLITPKNGLVLDPFCGSGSTLVAAKRHGFNYIGVELVDDYVKVANKRLDSISKTIKMSFDDLGV